MRKTLILFAAIVLSAVLHAQNEVTTFMGIPVDGTKEEVIGKLQEKGFVLSRSGDVLKGEYNGNEVSIEIQTHQDKVWRLAVSDAASVCLCKKEKIILLGCVTVNLLETKI